MSNGIKIAVIAPEWSPLNLFGFDLLRVVTTEILKLQWDFGVLITSRELLSSRPEVEIENLKEGGPRVALIWLPENFSNTEWALGVENILLNEIPDAYRVWIVNAGGDTKANIKSYSNLIANLDRPTEGSFLIDYCDPFGWYDLIDREARKITDNPEEQGSIRLLSVITRDRPDTPAEFIRWLRALIG